MANYEIGDRSDALSVHPNDGTVISVLKGIRALLGVAGATTVTANQGAAGVAAWPVTPAAALSIVTGTILNGQSLSGAIDLTAVGTPVAIITDAAWDTNAMTFQGSYDGITYTNLRTMGAEVQIPGVVASAMEPVQCLDFLACRYLKVRSGTAAAAVNQVGDTVVSIVCRPI